MFAITFSRIKRRVTNTDKQQLWKDYSRQKQTYKSLSGKQQKKVFEQYKNILILLKLTFL